MSYCDAMRQGRIDGLRECFQLSISPRPTKCVICCEVESPSRQPSRELRERCSTVNRDEGKFWQAQRSATDTSLCPLSRARGAVDNNSPEVMPMQLRLSLPLHVLESCTRTMLIRRTTSCILLAFLRRNPTPRGNLASFRVPSLALAML